MSNFIDEVVQEENTESIIDAIKKASIAICKQPIRVKSRKIKSSFSLDLQQDIKAMHGGDKDDFHGWLHDIKKMSQDDYYKLDEKAQHRLYKEYQLDSVYKEDDREKKWKPRGLFDDMLDGLQNEMQREIDREILNELKNKMPLKKK